MFCNMTPDVSKGNYWEGRQTYRVLKDENVSKTNVLIINSIRYYISL